MYYIKFKCVYVVCMRFCLYTYVSRLDWCLIFLLVMFHFITGVGFLIYPEHSHLIIPANQFTTAILHLCLQNTGFAAGTPNQLWFYLAEGWDCNADSHVVMLYSLICLPAHNYIVKCCNIAQFTFFLKYNDCHESDQPYLFYWI